MASIATNSMGISVNSLNFQGGYSFGKGEVVSSILTGSTNKIRHFSSEKGVLFCINEPSNKKSPAGETQNRGAENGRK